MSTREQSEGNQTPPPAGPPAQGTSVAVKPAAAKPPSKPLPQFKVILHNDDFNEMRYVVRTIIELTRLDSGRAMDVMLTAHKVGAALVLITHKERAELFKDQFATKRLKVTIEPVA
jgi:ATP-dependent Clp protease adaptor protein ClpS